MRIKIGDYDLLQSGTIVSNDNEPIDFFLAEEVGFVVRITFEKQSESSDPKVEAESFDKAGAHLKLINFDSSLGIGNTAPTPIGTYNHRELFLNYRVYSLEKGGKTFHYTWFLGKEVKNG